MMVRSVEVSRGTRVAHLQDGRFVELFGPGAHRIFTLSGLHELLPIEVALEPKALPFNDPLPEDLPGARILTVAPHERVAVALRGVPTWVLGPGRYRLWEELGEPTLRRFDVREAPAPLSLDDQIAASALYTIQTFAEAAVLCLQGRPRRAVPPGRYRCWAGSEWSLKAAPHEFSRVEQEAEADAPEGRLVLEVGVHERVAAFSRGVLLAVLQPGRYGWWEALAPVTALRVDIRDEPTPIGADDPLPSGSRATAWEEASGDVGTALVLVRDGRPLRVLPAGRYRAWTGGRWSLKPVPLSLQSLDVAPQDLLTADQVPVRIKPSASVRVVDPVAVLQQPDWPNQVYVAVQLALRDVVTGRSLEALLSERESGGAELLEKARARMPAVGMALEMAAIKDIILPGEIKDLLNRVTLARKEAEALSVKRREETASTRQLANTARLLESNPVLLRLKELEMLGDIAARIDKLTLVGGQELVRSVALRELVQSASREDAD